MNSILKSFFYRNFKTKGFWIQFALFGFVGLIAGIIAISVSQNLYAVYEEAKGEAWAMAYLEEYKSVSLRTMALLAINGGPLNVALTFPHIPLAVISILVSIRFHAEYSSGSMRNYVVSGYTRQQAYRSLFIGFLIYSIALYLSFALTLIAVCAIGGIYPGFDDAEAITGFIACAGLSFAVFFAYYCFVFFINTALGGNGFAGPLCILIYVGLCFVGLAADLFSTVNVSISITDPDAALEILKNAAIFKSFLPYGQMAVLGSGNLKALSTSLLAVFSSDEEVDYTLFNVLVILLENAGLGIGSFFLGQAIIAKRDLK